MLFLLVPSVGAAGVLTSAGRFRGRDRYAFVDTILFTVGLGILSWVLVISQYAHAGGFSPGVRMLSAAYLLSNMVLLAAAARLVFTAGSHTRTVLLLGWAVGHLVGNTLYSVQALQGTFQLGGPVFTAWILSYAVLGAAALHRSEPGPRELPARRSPPFRYAVLGVAVAPLPVLLVVRSLQRSLDDVAVIAAGSVVIAALFLARLLLATPSTVSAELRRTLRRSTTRLITWFVVLAFLPLTCLTYLGVQESESFGAQERQTARMIAAGVLLGQVMLVGLVAAVRSDRSWRQAAAQLGDREEHLRGIIEAAGDAFVAIDGAGRITEWNARATVVFGHRREEAMGADLAELVIPRAQRAAHRTGVTRLLAGGKGQLLDRRVEVTALRADGSEFPAELTLFSTYRSDGRSFNAFVRDVSDQTGQETQITVR
jgi:PAS domain S-box-containing protein